jgi:hypothetical protein
MRNFFSKQSLPPVEDLFNSLVNANSYLHPEWENNEVLFHSAHLARSCRTHKQFADKVNDVSVMAIKKRDEVATLEQQLQLTTDINN